MTFFFIPRVVEEGKVGFLVTFENENFTVEFELFLNDYALIFRNETVDRQNRWDFLTGNCSQNLNHSVWIPWFPHTQTHCSQVLWMLLLDFLISCLLLVLLAVLAFTLYRELFSVWGIGLCILCLVVLLFLKVAFLPILAFELELSEWETGFWIQIALLFIGVGLAFYPLWNLTQVVFPILFDS